MKDVTVEDIDLGWNKIKEDIQKLNKAHTDVGFFGSGGGPETNMAARATVHEFGSQKQNIPKRPFMRETFDRNLDATLKVMAIWYSKIFIHKTTPRNALKNIGEWYTGRMKLQITTGSFTPLKASTVRAKKSSKALIDTGQMRNSITHKERKN